MAQQDTGLGWSAKDNWLMQTASAVAEISEATGGYELPVIPNAGAADVLNNGALGYNRTQYNDGVKIVGEQEYIFGFIWNNGSYWRVGVVAYGANKTVKYAGYSTSSTTINQGTIPTPVTGYSGWYTAYFYNPCSTSQAATTDLPIITANSLDNAARQVIGGISIVTATINKSNPGFCVACVAKWKTPNNTVLESPILISTETDYVDMDTTLTGINLAKLNVLYNGVRFFMSFYDRPYTGALQTNLQVIDRSYSDAPTFTLEQLFRYIAKDVYANILITNAPDPYQEGDGSGEAGGDGGDDESDEIPFTDAPVSGIAYSGFLTIFTPNLSQLQSLANYMWSDFFDVDTWKKLFANPMDAILGLHIIPCSPGYSGNKEVKVGGKRTGVSMDYTTIRYHEVSMGTCTVPKKWGSYLDYNPYTKVSIFLPYIGFRDLDTDDVMDRTLALQYIVDILTGACVAELRCGSDVLYSWEGNCANPVPITSNSWSSAIGSAVSIAAAIATTALTHGASAPMIAGTVASVGANSMNLKPSVSRSGSLGGSGGFIAKQTPYIIRTVPNLVIPADQNKFIGYPSFVTASLGSLAGYNEISSIHLEGIPATGNELTEIETLLKGGVIF